MPRTPAVLCTFAWLALSCSSPPPAPDTSEQDASAEAAAEEWQVLFDGHSFDGWRGLGRDGLPEGHWQVEDGAIRKIASGDVPTAADGQPLAGGDLVTLATYDDFELAFEWKVAPGANSGIKYNVSEVDLDVEIPPEHAALGFEYQILDDDLASRRGKNGPNRTAGGALRPRGARRRSKAPASRSASSTRAASYFNVDGHGEHWLNGEKVLSRVRSRLRGLPAGRFSQEQVRPHRGVRRSPRKGHIVLQDHGDDVWFRQHPHSRAPAVTEP